MRGISISESTQDASYELFQVLRGGCNIHELARCVMVLVYSFVKRKDGGDQWIYHYTIHGLRCEKGVDLYESLINI